MKHTFILLSLAAMLLSFSTKTETDRVAELDALIDNWHLAAAQSKLDEYFEVTSADFVFLGTDPTERWDKNTFMAFCKPYFEQGKGWNFTKIERHWIFSSDKKTAWFDEKINTWMKDCRGCGMLEKRKGKWKLKSYNLSVLIENDKTKAFIDLRNN